MINRRAIHRRGMFVVLLGPDGAGKSTVADGIAQMADSEFPGLKHFHWRPGLLPKLSRSNNKQQADQSGQPVNDAPPVESAYGSAISLVRFLYYLADFILGYWWIIRPQVRRGNLVLGERWYYDVIAYPARYGFKLPAWVLRLGSWLLPNPDLTVLLSADPEAIHKRKPELLPALIEEQLGKLRSLLPLKPAGVELSSGCEPEQSIREVCHAILELNTQLRSSSEPGHDAWKGFPGYGEVKIWVGPSDTLKNALRLYHPCSGPGQLLKRAVNTFPDGIARKLFCRRMLTQHESDQVDKVLSFVEMTDEPRDVVVSVSTGTSGEHQKNTVQFSKRGRPYAYAKIGHSSQISTLVKNEHLTLLKLAEVESMVGLVPEPIGYWEDGEDKKSILVQSTLEQSLTPSSLQIDNLVMKFLLSLCETGEVEVEAKYLSQSLGVSSLIEEFSDKHPEVAALLQQALDALGIQDKVKYKVIPGHGDFAPWNVLRAGQSGSLFVIDWEYFNTETPALVDLFHFVFMPVRLVSGKKPLHAVNALIELCQSNYAADIGERCDISSREWNAYILWYFLWLAVREARGGTVSGYVQKCIRIIMYKMSVVGVRPKVLVGAYACEPDEGSEPGVGWNWVVQIAKEADIHVITRVNNRDAIEKAVTLESVLNATFSYVDVPEWLSFWKRGQRGVRTYYYLWQFFALRKARKLDSEEHFDLAHHVTFVNDWLWSFVGLLSLPYIWGPIGSHPPCPSQLITRKKSMLLEKIRVITQNTFRSLDPFYWTTMLRAARVVAITRESFDKFPLRFVPSAKRIVEPAIGMEELDGIEKKRVDKASRTVLYVGRLHYTKCPQLAVESFARCLAKFPDVRLIMIGAGPERESLEQVIEALHIQHAVTLQQQLPRSEVLVAMNEADVFLFPSTEGGGMVVLEAMASGLPVVGLDYGGPGEMIHGEGGVCVPIGSREQIIHGLSEAVMELLDKDDKRLDIGHAAQKRVSQCYEWSRKRDFVRSEYRAVIQTELSNE